MAEADGYRIEARLSCQMATGLVRSKRYGAEPAGMNRNDWRSNAVFEGVASL